MSNLKEKTLNNLISYKMEINDIENQIIGDLSGFKSYVQKEIDLLKDLTEHGTIESITDFFKQKNYEDAFIYNNSILINNFFNKYRVKKVEFNLTDFLEKINDLLIQKVYELLKPNFDSSIFVFEVKLTDIDIYDNSKENIIIRLKDTNEIVFLLKMAYGHNNVSIYYQEDVTINKLLHHAIDLIKDDLRLNHSIQKFNNGFHDNKVEGQLIKVSDSLLVDYLEQQISKDEFVELRNKYYIITESLLIELYKTSFHFETITEESLKLQKSDIYSYSNKELTLLHSGNNYHLKENGSFYMNGDTPSLVEFVENIKINFLV